MALEGTIIINNPFWWSADDKFFNHHWPTSSVSPFKDSTAAAKDYIPGIVSESLRNRVPARLAGIINYVGFPAFLKPFDGGGWKNVSRVNSLEELWAEYEKTGTLCMTLQQFIDFDQFVRCYCIGQEEVMVMAYDPRKPYLSGEQYVHNPDYLEPKLHARVVKDVRTLNRALGYDLNTVEFAIKDGVPYAIDFMNPAPDAELSSVGEFYHNWVTNAVTDLVFKRLAESRTPQQYRWDNFLNPAPIRTEAVASVSEQRNRKVTPRLTGGTQSRRRKPRQRGLPKGQHPRALVTATPKLGPAGKQSPKPKAGLKERRIRGQLAPGP
jgi:hypothetical protein